MKAYETQDIRNVALVGHGHSGKTSLTASLLFTTGATNRLTRVDEGNTVPFITRYRKDQTGGLDEEVIRRIESI